ncbi:Uncharacterised protein [Segatella oris]|uniref:Uncharacterized protein n=1 Tax=Segatella oris TaxID=28135 RepID=A0A448L2T1_9BACT|nr:Uncharacterised protein [Segatella oris]
MNYLPQPLPRRGELTCKEISYNSLRNYALYIVHYELTTIQHSSFNIKNYALCIVNYELTTIQHSTFNIKNYTSCIVHYALNKFDITDCAVAFQATESFYLHCNLMKTAPNHKANYTVT